MRRPLTPRERRGAALIVLALVLGSGYWLLIDSWFAGPLRSMGEQAEQLREQQQRYAACCAKAIACANSWSRRARTRPAAPAYCPATTPAPWQPT